jgi:N-hydroxyarylamine O-acetyltransferase
MDPFNQAAWLSRIGYSGSLEPTLGTLTALVKAHSHAIAYESIDIMLGRPADLGIVALQAKMIQLGRGGYCFEQNMLFRAGLRSLGYSVTGLQGRVVRGLDIDAPRAAIHMLLRVELPEGAYLADVGFGNLAPTAPLLLEPYVEQETPHELMRFIVVNDELTLQSRLGDRWEHIYRVIPHPRYDAEHEITNWYTSTHPTSPYLSNIIAARPAPKGVRVTLFNDRLTRRFADGSVERRQLQSEADFQRVIRVDFGLRMSDEEIHRAITVFEGRGTRGAPPPLFA